MTIRKDWYEARRLAAYPCSQNDGTHYIATSTQRGKHPQGLPRGGAEESPERTDLTVTNRQQPRPLRIRSGLEGGAKTETCSCGKVCKNLRGLKIHQTKMGCPKDPEHRTSMLGKTTVGQRQEENHSPQEHQARGQLRAETQVEDPNPAMINPVEEVRGGAENEPRKSQVKWPASNAEKDWEQLDDDLEGILESVLAGNAEKKLDAMVGIVYNVGAERFGKKEAGKKGQQKERTNRRERERQQIRKDLRTLRKRWKEADQTEREALKKLREDLRGRLKSLSKAERSRAKRRERQRKRSAFISNPFGFTKKLLGAKTSGKLTCSKEDIEAHLRKTHGDDNREKPLGDLDGLPDPEQPTHEMDCSEIRLAEVKEVIKKARAGSAPGPSGIPYKVYKKCPKLARRLWKLLKVVWRKKKIPESWKKAEGLFCAKQENAERIEQFRTISLLSVESKIFFAILARRLQDFMLKNAYIDTAVQKGGVPGYSGCLEHTAVITQLIQEAKSGKGDLAVVWLDLENAYGSVPHQLIKTALEKYHVPEHPRQIINQYMNGLKLRFTVNGTTTDWQRLERGIVTGCTISVTLFIAAMNLVIKPATEQSRGPMTRAGLRQPPLKAFMDDLTITTESVLSARWMLKSLDKTATWARLKFKARKCRKLVMRKGKLSDRLQLKIQGEDIPSVSEQPIKSLGKKFDASLGDRENCKDFKQQVVKGLQAIEDSDLPGKFKVWIYQYGLLPRIAWPMMMYEIPLSTVEEMERKVNSRLRKWLGVPPSFTSVGLYSTSAKLQLPITAMTEEFKVGKARALLTLEGSRDPRVSQAGIQLRSGRKWAVDKAVDEAKSRLRHSDIVGVVAQGRLGLGAGKVASQRWGTAGPKERRDMVQREVRRKEEEGRKSLAVSQGVQGAWTKWEGVRSRCVKWSDLWKCEPLRIQFLLRSVYDLLPTPVNLKRWGKEKEEKCQLCERRGTLSHVLSSCPIALGQGRYRWRHDQVLRVLACTLEEERTKKRGKNRKGPKFIGFVREGEGEKRKTGTKDRERGILPTASDWNLRVDLDRRLVFPEEISSTNLKPDVVLWSTQTKQIVLVELTVPWEERIRGGV
ncbi:PREDICTED: uncharacterized protein LOC109481744 [Branchiostoma belcheri]|uniref:Uncharacterized protein LOC109481744 n=1 Tax=Branchiostoma belcheri TaxID=7741 RepID=A0A6P5A0P7_BRABE|nr:PREDICTED: uncharacterized protein LOC109481744 [Branchiostoma belcheri]